MSKYKRRFGDRKDGRLLRSLPAFAKFIPYIMPTRNDASNQYEGELRGLVGRSPPAPAPRRRL